MERARRAYFALELERARNHIQAALARCRPGACSSEQRAYILVLAGVIEHVLDPVSGAAVEYFREAVAADPGVQLERELASPALDRMLAEAHATTIGGEGARPSDGD